MNTFFDDIDLYHLIEIINDGNKYCVIGKNSNNFIVRTIFKNNDNYFLGKIKKTVLPNEISKILYKMSPTII